METNIKDVYAAGDCCNLYKYRMKPHSINSNEGIHWFQMRLWTQARAMGVYTAHCMTGINNDFGSDFCFELFTHITNFFGYKVIMLGRYNGQGLGKHIEAITKEVVITKEGLVKKENNNKISQGINNEYRDEYRDDDNITLSNQDIGNISI